MSISPLLNSGLQGISSGMQGVHDAAQKIVRAGTVEGGAANAGIEEPVIDLKLYQRSVEASAKVVKTADEVLGTLLDALA